MLVMEEVKEQEEEENDNDCNEIKTTWKKKKME